MGEAARPTCSKRNGVGTSAGTMDDPDRLKGADGKINITTSDKTNKTPILVN